MIIVLSMTVVLQEFLSTRRSYVRKMLGRESIFQLELTDVPLISEVNITLFA